MNLVLFTLMAACGNDGSGDVFSKENAQDLINLLENTQKDNKEQS